ncbi:MAG: response regulator, partial [Bacteroidales bacterium]|nr:response regulator [Bacteroidales bacterium]
MKKKIIIAEDSPTQAENLKFNLEELGYEAEIASNGMIALNLIKTTPPDLVISDILMPEMDGYALCKAVKSDSRLRHIPVILLSSLSDSSDVINGLVSGADNFISKPIDEDSLGRVVATIMENPGTDEPVSEMNEFSVTMDGTAYTLTASHEKMLRFLHSTYDTAILKNQSLLTAQRELSDLNKTLESKVTARTAELAKEVEERKRAEQSIRERERVIREITENLRELVFKTDLEGIYLWVNSAHAIYAGYSQEELIGRSFFEFIHPEDQDGIIKLFRERMAEGIQYAVEFKFQHAEGHFIWMECTANFIPGETEASGSIVFAAHEITERKDFENELIHGREKALKSDLLKSSFLANMSHDIRTPMNAIIGFSELLKEKELTEEEQKKFLDQITRNGESLLNLVNDIIDVSKIEAGVLAIHKTNCPVNHICQELDEFYSGYLALKAKKQVTLVFTRGFDDQNQLIVTDP